jgi:hypothetical protein
MDGSLYQEFKILHGRRDKVEKQLNELTAQGWEFVAVASGSAGFGGFLFFAFAAAVTVVLKRSRPDGPAA